MNYTIMLKVNLARPDSEELPVPDIADPNDQTGQPTEQWTQPSVAEIAERIAAERGEGVNPIELEDYAGPGEHQLADETEPAPPAPGPATSPVERKVWVGALWAVLGPVAVAVLAALADHATGADLSGLPPWAQLLVLALAGGASSFAAGYRARHTPRPDLSDESA